jgi:hypothetical protein
MAGLTEMVESQGRMLMQLTQEVKYLQTLVMRDKIDTTWVPERDAAAMLDMQPDTLRRYVKAGKPFFNQINFRHTNGRKWQYSRKDLIKFKNLTSTNA